MSFRCKMSRVPLFGVFGRLRTSGWCGFHACAKKRIVQMSEFDGLILTSPRWEEGLAQMAGVYSRCAHHRQKKRVGRLSRVQSIHTFSACLTVCTGCVCSKLDACVLRHDCEQSPGTTFLDDVSPKVMVLNASSNGSKKLCLRSGRCLCT